MSTLKEILDVVRDIGIVIGVPALFVLLIRIWQEQNRAHKDEVNALKAKVDFLEQTQFPGALAVIEAQRKLHEMELDQLREERERLEARAGADPQEVKAVDERIRQNLDQLHALRQDITDGIESEATRKLELFCKNLADPDRATPESIFLSATYGDGLSFLEVRALERKGLIAVQDEVVRLTEKGKSIWRTVHDMRT